MRTALYFVVATGLAYALGRAQSQASKEGQAPPAADVEAMLVQTRDACVRAAERQAQAVTTATVAPLTKPETAIQAAAPVPSAAAVEATARASQTIADALGRKQWTSDDVRAFRAAAVDMEPGERERLILRVTQALNAGELAPTFRGLPF